jgi:hypothetical protein
MKRPVCYFALMAAAGGCTVNSPEFAIELSESAAQEITALGLECQWRALLGSGSERDGGQ